MENFPETGDLVRLPALLPFPAKLTVYARTISVSGPRNEQEIFGKKKRKSKLWKLPVKVQILSFEF